MIKPYKPNFSDPAVYRILDHLNAEFEPVEIKVTPLKGVEKLDCFQIVENKVKKDGGAIIYGWQIWKSDLIIEAECHAVWEDSNQKLWDLTPKPNGIRSIMFLEDPSIAYEGKQIDNIRLNITSNLLVDDFIKTFEVVYKIMNKGDRASQYDEIRLYDEEADDYHEIQKIQTIISELIRTKKNKNSICLCGAGISFSQCHEKIIEKISSKY